jgi:hypothetical protein
MKAFTITMIVLLAAAAAFAQGPRRNRGEGMYRVTSSNTVGEGNSWLTLRGIGFIWASKPDSAGTPGIFPFFEVSSETGIFSFASLQVATRMLSYPKNHWPQYGNVSLAAKFTLPDNKELRFRGYGLELKYIYNIQNSFASLGGYRVGGTGFNAEGYITEGSVFEFLLIHDMDFIPKISWLPLKLGLNAGMRIPLTKESDPNASYIFPQFLFNAGVAYVGLGFDIFAEYSLEAFNNISGPKPITGLSSVPGRRMEIFFQENPMYLTLGGRIRYDNGIELYLCAPLLLSTNAGSSMTTADNIRWNTTPVFDDEKARGINERFDPWFAKWKIVGELTFPIFYKQTGSEMMRNFLLLKGSPKGKKFDIDEQLKKANAQSDSLASTEKEKKKRLDDINKRREQIEKSE